MPDITTDSASPDSNKSCPEFHAVIVAAGSGARADQNIPKQYRKIGGIPLLQRSIDKIASMPALQSLTIVISSDHKALFETLIDVPEDANVSIGGDGRKDSVSNGLNSISNVENEDIILIHDAARPFVRPRDIAACLSAAQDHGAATLAAPISGTLRRDSGEYVDRSNLWEIQTPQCFQYNIVMQAHENVPPQMIYTDDGSLVEASGHSLKIVQGSKDNIKITYPEDFVWAETYVNGVESKEHKAMDIRTGQGFDVHAFDFDSKGPVRLFGVDVPHTHKLKGHSDADVGLHAITDALLSAIGAGDIGLHFPPSDMQWKGKDSAYFLDKSVDMLRITRGVILNIDATLICERPKLGEYREQMQKNVARICDVDFSRVNIKATTSEKLGFTGRGEGIAAQAIVTVKIGGDHG